MLSGAGSGIKARSAVIHCPLGKILFLFMHCRAVAGLRWEKYVLSVVARNVAVDYIRAALGALCFGEDTGGAFVRHAPWLLGCDLSRRQAFAEIRFGFRLAKPQGLRCFCTTT